MKKIFYGVTQFALSTFASGALYAADDICAQPRNDLIGIYEMRINIAGKEFLDLVSVTKACQSGSNSGVLSGNISVPERFSTKILDGTFNDDVAPQVETLSFDIDTLESGQPLKAHYVMVDRLIPGLGGNHECTGQVTFEGEADPVPLTCAKLVVDFRYLK